MSVKSKIALFLIMILAFQVGEPIFTVQAGKSGGRSNSSIFSQNIFEENLNLFETEERDSNLERLDIVSNADSKIKNDFSIFIDKGMIRELSKKDEEKINYLLPLVEGMSFNQVLSKMGGRQEEELPKDDVNYGVEKLDHIQLDDSYQELQDNVEDFVARLVQAYPGTEVTVFEENLENILFMASYLNRWYNVKVNDCNLWNILMFSHAKIAKNGENDITNIVSFVDYLQDKNVMKSSKVVEAFKNNTVFTNLDTKTYKGLIEWFVSTKGDTKDYTTWFRNYFNGSIYIDSQLNSAYDVGIWNKNINEYLPYLLSIRPDSDFVIAEFRKNVVFTSKSNYPNNLEEVLSEVVRAITTYMETLERTMENGTEIMSKFNEKVIIDSDNVKDMLYSPAALTTYLLLPTLNTSSYGWDAAIAGGNYTFMRAENLSFLNTVVHEFTHHVDWDLFSVAGEALSMYLDDTSYGAYYEDYWDVGSAKINVDDSAFSAYDIKIDTYSNKKASRFQTKGDLIQYTVGMESLIYTLDAAIAEVVLSLPIEEQVKYIKKVDIDVETGTFMIDDYWNDSSSYRLTKEELLTLDINSIEDLINRGMMIVEPTDASTTNSHFSYGTSVTYATYYLAHSLSNQDQTNRIINTLLSYDGWEGLRKYNTIFHKKEKDTPLQALRETFDNENLTYKSLLQQNYDENVSEVKEKGYIDGRSYEDIKKLFSNNIEGFYSIKQNLIQNYLHVTNEFRYGVFGEGSSLIAKITTYDELIQAMMDNMPMIQIQNDLVVSGVHQDLIVDSFGGIIRGNGYTISRLTHPLVNKLDRAEVSSLVLKDVNIQDAESIVGALASEVVNSQLNDIHAIGKISSKDHVGGIVGSIKNSAINGCSVDVRLAGDYTGGIAGISDDSSITDSYSIGEITKGDRVGGIAGNAFNKSKIKNVYSAMSITSGGGVVGSTYNSSNTVTDISNVLSLVNVEKGDKVLGNLRNGSAQNNYELDSTSGTSSVGVAGLDVTEVTENQIRDMKTYEDRLTWDIETIWNVENISEKYPYLRNSDPRNIKEEIKLPVISADSEITYEILSDVSEEQFLKDIHAKIDKEGMLISDFESVVDLTKIGEYIVTLDAEDLEENQAESIEVKVIIEQTISNIIVEYVNKKGKEVIASDKFTGKIGEGYITRAKEIPNYILKKTPSNAIGVFAEEIQTVTYVYEWMDEGENNKNKNSHAQIILEEINNTEKPTEPELPIDLEDPDNPDGEVENGGTGNTNALRVDWVTPFEFGTHDLVNEITTYTLENREHNPFVQISDFRGTGTGWTLQVSRTEFTDDTKILKGAELTLPAGKLYIPENNLSNAPIIAEVITVNGNVENVMKAGVGEGMGTWVNIFNKGGVKLIIPSGNYTGDYKATLTWTLSDALE